VSQFTTIAVASLSAPALSLQTNAFDPPTLMQVFILVPSQSVSGIPILQFNGDNGTTSYAYNITGSTLPLGIVTLVGATGIAGVANGIFLAQSNTTGPVSSEIIIGNGPSQAHSMMISGEAGLTDASAAPAIITGSGIWANTARITSLQLISSGGGNLGAGTGLLVLGINA
jgi:hypothetical protein